jgi:hypothetical protein
MFTTSNVELRKKSVYFSLKLPNCGLFIIYALAVLECRKARIGLSQVMGTIESST